MRKQAVKKNSLKKYRKNHNLSQTELAKKIGCNKDTIYKIEKGKIVPGLVLAVRIARVLNVNLEDIFYIDD